MGFMDKVKQAAEKAAEGAKKGTASAKEKIEAANLKRKSDGLAQQLGYLIYRERAEGATAGAEADQLVEEIKGIQAQIAELGGSDEAAAPEAPAAGSAEAAPAPPTASEPQAEGDFKLD